MEAAVSRHQAVALSAPSESLEAAYPPAHPRFELQLAPAHDTPTATLQSVDVRPRERSETATRVVNVTIALIGLVAASPLMVVVALLVKLTSRGPVLYSQTRVGVDRRYKRSDTDDRRVHDHGGKPFEMYKFRSMAIDSEADGRAVWAAREDPRATPIGRVLRKTRLDELPQFYNIGSRNGTVVVHIGGNHFVRRCDGRNANPCRPSSVRQLERRGALGPFGRLQRGQR